MTFIEYRGALQEVNETEYWHLVASGCYGDMFYNNVKCERGFLHSVSYMIELDPNLASAVTPYSMFKNDQEKEAVFERVRIESYVSKPSRMKAIFALHAEEDVVRVMREWFPNEARTPHRAWILNHSRIHVADSKWLNQERDQWESAAHSYWSGERTSNPLEEVIVHGTLYFPDWENFPP